MSEYTAPVNALFETQRTAIRQSQRAVEQGIEFQRNANRTALYGARSLESTQRQGVELLQAGTRSYLSAVGAVTPGNSTAQVRRSSDEAFDRLKEAHAELFDAIRNETERGVESYDDVSMEYLESIDEQLDELLETHEEIQEQTTGLADEFGSQAEDFAQRYEEGLQQQMERAEEIQAEVEGQIEVQAEQAEQFQDEIEAQAEQMQAQLDEQAERMQEVSMGASGAESLEADGQPIEEIDGLGSTYADRLADVGIETTDDLRTAGTDTVAEAADVSKERAAEWVERAEN